MSVTKEQITAALKKLGPSKPGELADQLGVDKLPPALLMEMLQAKELKATGATVSRRLALPDQKFDDAGAPTPPQGRLKGKKHRKAKHARKAPAPAPRAAEPAVRFIPAVDAEKRLVIVNGAEPYIFTGEQTEAIASLLLQHYEA